MEISCHGSPVVLEEVVRLGVRAGARPADPGEFTLRAYLNGRLDIIQAEAVDDLIRASSLTQARISFDQLGGSLSRRIAALRGKLIRLLSGRRGRDRVPRRWPARIPVGHDAEDRLAYPGGRGPRRRIRSRTGAGRRPHAGHRGKDERRKIHALQRPPRPGQGHRHALSRDDPRPPERKAGRQGLRLSSRRHGRARPAVASRRARGDAPERAAGQGSRRRPSSLSTDPSLSERTTFAFTKS